MSTWKYLNVALACTALAACFGTAASGSEPAGMAPGSSTPIQVVGSDSGSRFVQLGIGKSVVIDLPRDIKDVLVAEPKFANAVVRSTRRAYLIGVAVGQTNIYFFDAEGKQIAGFDVAVTRDLNGVRAMLQKLLPHSDVRVDGVGDGVMLSGRVANAAESQQAYDVASAPGRQHRQGRQQSHHSRPRSGDAQGDGRRSAARHHQAARHRSQREPHLRHRGAQLQQLQPVHRARPAAGRRQRSPRSASRA